MRPSLRLNSLWTLFRKTALRGVMASVLGLAWAVSVPCGQSAIAQTVEVSAATVAGQQDNTYFPGQWGEWETRSPEDAGFDAEKLQAAVEFAIASENRASRDLAESIRRSFGREPHNEIIGPTKERGAANGMIIRHGYLVAEWGDTSRVDMTFSVTKSFLSTVYAIAESDGDIRDANDLVKDYVRDGSFASEHNSQITWEHLLQQTSDWSGELWGKPDWADRPRGRNPEAWPNRQLRTPGTSYKYNDVRVNLLAHSLLKVLQRPLPAVLKERVMDKIGASPTWRWHGYENSFVTINGQMMKSVSGGGHWGGGMFICTRDQARFGYLFLRNGRWRDEQVLPAEWITALRQPCEVRPDYGYMWWLNTNGAQASKAPESAFCASGFGGNYIFVDHEHDLLIVLRWTPALEGVVNRVIDAIEE
ncbi:MAG: beta-lactamase family protein [Pirellulales bacterium]|nr:beta-lactamase family protein [Pirellulales bacterium]